MEKMITTQQGLQLIKLLGSLNLKQNMIDMIKETSRLEKEKKIVMQKLLKNKSKDEKIKDEKITEESTIELFNNNPDMSKEYSEIQIKLEELSANLFLDFIFALGDNQEMFCKTIANIFNVKVSEIKNQGLDVTINEILEIFQSPTFTNFFSLMKK